MLDKLKILYPSLPEDLLLLLLENAENFVTDYCNLESLDGSLDSVVFRIIQEDITKVDSQGLGSESAGGVSLSYTSDYSPMVYAALNRHKRIRTVK